MMPRDSHGRTVEFADEPFTVDPIPRVIPARCWERVERGLAQRVRALERFTCDAYGRRRCVADGVVPARLIEGSRTFDAKAAEFAPGEGRPWIGVAGLDLVCAEDGAFRVLEDNCRNPSGLAYALAARDLAGPADGVGVRPLDDVPALLRDTLEDFARQPGLTVVLTDGPANSAHYEHRRLAAEMDVRLVTIEDLWVDGDRLRADGAPVAVVYRRTDATSTGSPVAELLAPALRAGAVAMVNAFGTGVADDKLTHVYVEDLIHYYLGEEPVLRSVTSYDLGVPEQRDEVLERLAELVVKPRDGQGGQGVVIGPQADDDTLAQLRRDIAATPDAFIAQAFVALSTEPTAIAGGVAPRHVDLRPFVLCGPSGTHVVPGGLTRVALAEGELIVNSSRDGGAKDTWVLE